MRIGDREEALLELLAARCGRPEFFRRHRDECILTMICRAGFRGRGIKLRPSLLKLERLGDAKKAGYLIRELRARVGPVAAEGEIKMAALDLLIKRLNWALRR